MFKIESVPDDEWQKVVSTLCPDPKRVVLKDVYLALKKQGIYISLVSILPELGYDSSNQFIIFKKLLKIDEKIELAFKNNFYLEWLSLLLIKAEFWLRVFLYNQEKYANKNVLNDGLSFGTIINECRIAGMKNEIINKLQRLNNRRILYIHNYLKGDFDYESIRTENTNFGLLVKELQEYCTEMSLRILDNVDDLDNAVGFVRPVRLKSK